ncbi:MAG: AmmeMemoRadiSam system protein B [Magnetococcus sp. DMHC-6]
MTGELQNVRVPAVAGMFYPERPEVLRTMVRQFLAQVPVGKGSPCAMIAPHAGYVYSGYTAACAYRTLSVAQISSPRRVFVLAPSHRCRLVGVSVGNYRAYATPLGEVSLDEEIIQRLLQQADVSRANAPHQQEHSLEVQLPFLQEVLGHFQLVPLVYGEISHRRLAALVLENMAADDLLVASSDLSHFHPYEEAKKLDANCHRAVLGLDAPAMNQNEACGRTAMAALLEIAKQRNWRPVLADYRNSGDTAGDKQRVVGYASYLFYSETLSKESTDFAGASASFEALPALLRTHLQGVLQGRGEGRGEGRGGLKPVELMAQIAGLDRQGACFITLTKNKQLRGCICFT